MILFDFWRISTMFGLIASMVAIFFMAAAYEGLKYYREVVFRRQFVVQRSR